MLDPALDLTEPATDVLSDEDKNLPFVFSLQDEVPDHHKRCDGLDSRRERARCFSVPMACRGRGTRQIRFPRVACPRTSSPRWVPRSAFIFSRSTWFSVAHHPSSAFDASNSVRTCSLRRFTSPTQRRASASTFSCCCPAAKRYFVKVSVGKACAGALWTTTAGDDGATVVAADVTGTYLVTTVEGCGGGGCSAGDTITGLSAVVMTGDACVDCTWFWSFAMGS